MYGLYVTTGLLLSSAIIHVAESGEWCWNGYDTDWCENGCCETDEYDYNGYMIYECCIQSAWPFIIGGVCVLVVIVIVICLCCCCYKKQKHSGQVIQQPQAMTRMTTVQYGQANRYPSGYSAQPQQNVFSTQQQQHQSPYPTHPRQTDYWNPQPQTRPPNRLPPIGFEHMPAQPRNQHQQLPAGYQNQGQLPAYQNPEQPTGYQNPGQTPGNQNPEQPTGYQNPGQFQPSPSAPPSYDEVFNPAYPPKS